MNTSHKGMLSVGAIVVILAGVVVSPAGATTIDQDFVISGPGEGLCRIASIEFFTPGSSRRPRFETVVVCGNQTKTVHYRSNHTDYKITEAVGAQPVTPIVPFDAP